MTLTPSALGDASENLAHQLSATVGGAGDADECWLIDAAQEGTQLEGMFFAIVLHETSGQILGSSKKKHLDTGLFLEALQMALQAHPPSHPLRIRTDRLEPFQDPQWQAFLRDNLIVHEVGPSRSGHVKTAMDKALQELRAQWIPGQGSRHAP